jgi:hypothetical protein
MTGPGKWRFTASRAYKSQDNALVEGKNGAGDP